MEKTKEELTCLLAECSERSKKEIALSMDPIQDLEMDSVSLLNFILCIEDKYGINFEDFAELSQHMSNVEEMLKFLMRKIEEGAKDE